MIPEFTLNDAQGLEVELSDALVTALDKANRPYKYDGKKRGRNRIWRAETPFFKKIWGWTRYRTGTRGTYREGDNGAFIKYEELQEILFHTNCPWWLLEEQITALRRGQGKIVKTRLPVKPDRWWAKLFGFYYSSGGVYNRARTPKGHGQQKEWIEYNFRFSVDDEVVPMLRELGNQIGDNIYETTYIPLYDGPHKMRGLRAGVRQGVLFSYPTWLIAHKFGLPEPPWERNKGNIGRNKASRNYRPYIPEWILNDDECMHDFIEAYVNGQRGHSMMHVIKGNRGLYTAIFIRFRAEEHEDVEIFAEQVSQWLGKQGIQGYYRETPRSAKQERNPEFEYIIHNIESLKKF